MRIFILIFCIFLSVDFAQGNVYQSVESNVPAKTQFDTYIKQMSAYRDLPINELLVKTALLFVDKPYVASTLERGDVESLVVNFDEFDCTTFVETCVALSLTIKSEEQTFEKYCSLLTSIRYREGNLDGYVSRLHYMIDWINDNEKAGFLRDMTIQLGGETKKKTINFMSEHPQSYKQLKENKANLEKIKQVENIINEQYKYTILSKAKILKASESVNIGDIIIFATVIDGLDFSHIGIAYRENGILRFIHASSRAKRVVVESKTLNKYCEVSKQCTGISVLRLNQ